jgi:glutamate-1-semialdehyde 2,1-aminomutase
MPVGAFGGRSLYMEMVAPLGPVYQAGTLSGNPVAMAAGLANLDLICKPGFYQNLESSTSRLMEGISSAAKSAGVPLLTTQVGAMFGLFFTEETEVINFEQAGQCNVKGFKRFFHLMLEQGVYLAPSAYEAGFVSSAHDEETIDLTIDAAGAAFAQIVAHEV